MSYGACYCPYSWRIQGLIYIYVLEGAKLTIVETWGVGEGYIWQGMRGIGDGIICLGGGGLESLRAFASLPPGLNPGIFPVVSQMIHFTFHKNLQCTCTKLV